MAQRDRRLSSVIDFSSQPTYCLSMEGFYRKLGQRLRHARRRPSLDLTQEQVAQRAGISRSSLANIETGRQQTPLHVFLKLAAALELEPADLLPKEVPRQDHRQIIQALQEKDIDSATIERVISRIQEEEHYEHGGNQS